MSGFRLAAVGDNCIDRFQPPLGQTLIGGNALNVAVQMARLGHEAFYFGAVGRDAGGDATRAVLVANGVHVDHLQRRDGNTAFTDIDVLPSGERILSYEDFGVCRGYRPDPRDMDALLTMDHVHLGWLDDGGALRETLAAAGVSCSQDISVNATAANLGVAGLSIAFGSAGDDRALASTMLDGFLSRGARLGVVTLGPSGAMAGSGTATAQVPAEIIDPVDTTGAGDSFIAAFLVAHLEGRPLDQALASGCSHAARTCLHVGGFPQEPGILAV